MDVALLMLADGRLPTGGHAHSAGVEAAAAIGDVRDEPSLARYLAGRLAIGVTEAAFAAAACARLDEPAALDELDRELEARICAPRSREVSRRLGRQLLRVGARAWPHPCLERLAAPPGAHQAIASGALVAAAGGAPGDAARLALHHLAAAVTTAGVRLLGLDPIAVAALHAGALPLIAELASPAGEWAAGPAAELPAVGGALAEILAEHHGAWDARLFVA